MRRFEEVVVTEEVLCPCGTGKNYQECCGPLLAGEKQAETAEELMRSRFTAYSEENWNYLVATRYGSEGQLETYTPIDWVALHILVVRDGGREDETGMVEFQAVCHQGETLGILHERSRFCRENGRWYYLDGELMETQPIPLAGVKRNAPCPCGSGRKFKKCCRTGP